MESKNRIEYHQILSYKNVDSIPHNNRTGNRFAEFNAHQENPLATFAGNIT
mgnify:CR=1 FL=1